MKTCTGKIKGVILTAKKIIVNYLKKGYSIKSVKGNVKGRLKGVKGPLTCTLFLTVNFIVSSRLNALFQKNPWARVMLMNFRLDESDMFFEIALKTQSKKNKNDENNVMCLKILKTQSKNYKNDKNDQQPGTTLSWNSFIFLTPLKAC